jgi:hypothetical protein
LHPIIEIEVEKRAACQTENSSIYRMKRKKNSEKLLFCYFVIVFCGKEIPSTIDQQTKINRLPVDCLLFFLLTCLLILKWGGTRFVSFIDEVVSFGFFSNNKTWHIVPKNSPKSCKTQKKNLKLIAAFRSFRRMLFEGLPGYLNNYHTI